MNFAATAALLAVMAPFGDLPPPGCWAESPSGDRLVFTDSLFVWIYDPAGIEPDNYEYEGCAYGLDPDVGTHTLTCEEAGIDAPVRGTTADGLEIAGIVWNVGCPTQT